jgi:hypothetical protein
MLHEWKVQIARRQHDRIRAAWFVSGVVSDVLGVLA